MRNGIFLDRTPAVGGRGLHVTYNEGALVELLASVNGPVGRHLERVGEQVSQEAKRLAPTSPHGNHGRPSGYLRSSIGHETGVDSEGVHVDIGSHALTPDGTDYGYIVEVGHHTASGSFVPPNPYLRGALDVVR